MENFSPSFSRIDVLTSSPVWCVFTPLSRYLGESVCVINGRPWSIPYEPQSYQLAPLWFFQPLLCAVLSPPLRIGLIPLLSVSFTALVYFTRSWVNMNILLFISVIFSVSLMPCIGSLFILVGLSWDFVEQSFPSRKLSHRPVLSFPFMN